MRHIVLTTDDGEEAFRELLLRKKTGESGWDMAEVRWMSDPPKTIHKFCVFQNREEPSAQEEHHVYGP
jgi:hypothetical protein